jgi:hypothetical protein
VHAAYGKTLSDIYEEDEDEEAFIDRELKLDPEFAADLAENDPVLAALLARDVQGFAARLEQAREKLRDNQLLPHGGRQSRSQ